MTGYGLALLVALPLFADAPAVTNGKLEERAAPADFRAAAGAGPAWFGYQIRTRKAVEHGCEHGQRSSPVRLEPAHAAWLLFRVEQGKVHKLRIVGTDCAIDAGGLTLHWFNGVSPRASLDWLATLAHEQTSALMMIAQHDDAGADALLERFAAAPHTDNTREKALFWMGAARGAAGLDALKRFLASQPPERLAEKALFALSVNKEPGAARELLSVARTHASPALRGKALFWAAQQAGRETAPAAREAADKDPDAGVKRAAVMALSRLPAAEAVPQLIELARTNKNPEVRRQAMFWLGRSKDPRAIAFFEEVLR